MPSHRVANPGTIKRLDLIVGSFFPVVEALRIPGRGYSMFRVWLSSGGCWELVVKAPWYAAWLPAPIRKLVWMRWLRPQRREIYDRKGDA